MELGTYRLAEINKGGGLRQKAVGQATQYLNGVGTWVDMPTSMTPTAHNHAASEITSGTLELAQLPRIAAGSIYVGAGTSNAISTLAKGSALQALRTNASATSLEWYTTQWKDGQYGTGSIKTNSATATGLRSGDEAKPYVYWGALVGQDLKAGGLAGIDQKWMLISPSTVATYAYGGVEYTYNNATANYVFLLLIDNADFIGSATNPFNICRIIANAGTNYLFSYRTILTVGTPITGNVYPVIVSTASSTAPSGITYTESVSLYAPLKSSSTNYTGYNSVASGAASVASGQYSVASCFSSVASGNVSVASGLYSIASGDSSVASGAVSVASGYASVASGYYSVASGNYSVASGANSVALGERTIAGGEYQTVIGKWNLANTTDAFIIGKGTSEASRSNCMTVDFSGNMTLSGGLTIPTKAGLDRLAYFDSAGKLQSSASYTLSSFASASHSHSIPDLYCGVPNIVPGRILISGSGASSNPTWLDAGTNGKILGWTSGAPAWVDAEASHNHDSTYLKLSGGTMTGGLSGTSATLTGTLTAGTINGSGLTASRAVITDASKNLVSSSVTSTEIGYLSGVTTYIQTQLDGRYRYIRTLGRDEDVNDCLSLGCMTNMGATSTNVVGSSYGTLATLCRTDYYRFQFYILHNGRLYKRSGGNSWDNWSLIYDSVNANLTTVDWSAKNLTLSGSITGATTVTATSFVGAGSSITSLNASNLSSGTVPIGRLPVGTESTQVSAGDHTHSGYATSTHNHDSAYSAIGHDHSGTYALASHTHSGYATSTHNHDATYLKLSGGTVTGKITLDTNGGIYKSGWDGNRIAYFVSGDLTTSSDYTTSSFALAGHTHSGYATSTHNHSIPELYCGVPNIVPGRILISGSGASSYPTWLEAGTNGKILGWTSGAPAWVDAPSGSSVTAANPTASVGLTAVNGSAATFMRSDAAPKLDVSIAPTWTGNHTFSGLTKLANVGIGVDPSTSYKLYVVEDKEITTAGSYIGNYLIAKYNTELTSGTRQGIALLGQLWATGGTLTNAKGLDFKVYVPSGTVTEATAINAVIQTDGGSIGTAYALKLSRLGTAPTANYGIYQEDSAATNVFNGPCQFNGGTNLATGGRARNIRFMTESDDIDHTSGTDTLIIVTSSSDAVLTLPTSATTGDRIEFYSTLATASFACASAKIWPINNSSGKVTAWGGGMGAPAYCFAIWDGTYWRVGYLSPGY